jgi:hypothetical protein
VLSLCGFAACCAERLRLSGLLPSYFLPFRRGCASPLKFCPLSPCMSFSTDILNTFGYALLASPRRTAMPNNSRDDLIDISLRETGFSVMD